MVYNHISNNRTTSVHSCLLVGGKFRQEREVLVASHIVEVVLGEVGGGVYVVGNVKTGNASVGDDYFFGVGKGAGETKKCCH